MGNRRGSVRFTIVGVVSVIAELALHFVNCGCISQDETEHSSRQTLACCANIMRLSVKCNRSCFELQPSSPCNHLCGDGHEPPRGPKLIARQPASQNPFANFVKISKVWAYANSTKIQSAIPKTATRSFAKSVCSKIRPDRLAPFHVTTGKQVKPVVAVLRQQPLTWA